MTWPEEKKRLFLEEGERTLKVRAKKKKASAAASGKGKAEGEVKGKWNLFRM